VRAFIHGDRLDHESFIPIMIGLTRPVIAALFRSGSIKADVHAGISRRTQGIRKLIYMTAKQIHRFGPVETEHDVDSVRVQCVGLQAYSDAAKFIGRKRKLCDAVCFADE